MNEFEKLMKREGMENIFKKPKEVYIVRHWLPGEPNGTTILEFDTKKEYDEWYEDVGKAIEEAEGGKIKWEFGSSELGEVEE